MEIQYFLGQGCKLIFLLMDLIDNNKFRNLIFERIFGEIYDKTYYPYGRELWIIDFENREWYFQYNSDGVLCYNHKFFGKFFRIFSLSQKQYQKLLKIWFETHTKHKVNHISRRNLDIGYYIDGMKRSDTHKWSLNERYGFGYSVIRRFLKIKTHISENDIKLEYFLT